MPTWLDRLRAGRRRPGDDGPDAILTGPITPTLLGLSIPMILAMFLVTSYGLVDMIYLGRFSKEAMAAISLAFPVTYLLHTFGGALGSAATSLCSRLIGGGRERELPNLVLHVALVAGALALLLIPGGLALLEPALRAPGTDPVVRDLARQYGSIYFLGGFFSLFAMSMNALFRGEGDTIFPFKVMALGLVLNVVLNPLFIFGPGPLPRLGVAGAALTTVVSFAFASLLVLRELRKGAHHRRVRLERGAWRWNRSLLGDLLGVAGPATLANLALPVSLFLINRMLASQGTAALAAFGAGLRLLSFVFLPTLGLSLSMMIMVGQNHGAGQRERVREITLTTLRFALTLLAALALPVILFPRWAMGLMTDDAAVIDAGWAFARWATAARPMLSVVNITAFWFQARGQGLAGMVPNTTLRVVLEPLGVWLGLQWGGLAGGWYGFAVGDAIGGAIFLALLWWRLAVYTRQAGPGPRHTPIVAPPV
ncbi:MAG: MATE family efflux transporter [Candidatus Krumholzibacteria bacterium]|nr:MATE family efflux transporter [Candidatus Krumholzibacteria bacterium]